MLSNIYLHEVLDRWFYQEVRPRMRGQAHLVRYADDAVLVFADEQDAKRVLTVLPKRFEKYGLSVHSEKTRLVRFTKLGAAGRGGGESFDFLGFTHYWGRSRRGAWVVRRKTASKRFTRALKRVALWCRLNRHQPLREQQSMLSLKLAGHCNYYGITGNYRSLWNFRRELERLWQKWLGRRSSAPMTWYTFQLLLRRYPLPQVRVVRSVLAAKL
jgi:RNA-directed DNA polymerase